MQKATGIIRHGECFSYVYVLVHVVWITIEVLLSLENGCPRTFCSSRMVGIPAVRRHCTTATAKSPYYPVQYLPLYNSIPVLLLFHSTYVLYFATAIVLYTRIHRLMFMHL